MIKNLLTEELQELKNSHHAVVGVKKAENAVLVKIRPLDSYDESGLMNVSRYEIMNEVVTKSYSTAMECYPARTVFEKISVDAEKKTEFEYIKVLLPGHKDA